jgi:orotate phosphoribosyltransferase
MAGPVEPHHRVLVVEDTATSGGSIIEAIDALQAFGCTVVGASVLLDRGGELGAILAARDIAYFPVLGAPDVGFAFGS